MFQNYDSLMSNESSRRGNHPLRNFTGQYTQPAYMTSRGGYEAQFPRNDLEYLRRPYRNSGQRDRSYHSNDQLENANDGAPIDYNQSNVHSLERAPAASATNKVNEDLLHDWKAFRENIREKVGQMEKCNTARVVAPATVTNRDQSKEEVSSPRQH